MAHLVGVMLLVLILYEPRSARSLAGSFNCVKCSIDLHLAHYFCLQNIISVLASTRARARPSYALLLHFSRSILLHMCAGDVCLCIFFLPLHMKIILV